MRRKRGFTLIELIAVMVIIGIIASAGAFFIPFFKLLFYPPKQTDTIYVANLLVNYVTEKNPYFLGLRYARKIMPNRAYPYYIGYVDGKGKKVYLYRSWNTKQISYYILNSGQTTWKPLVYDAAERGVKVKGLDSYYKLFKYLDSDGQELFPPIFDTSQIKTVELNWLVYTGNGNPAKGDGRVEIRTAIEIKQFE